jgi:hypothetical protein
MQTDCSYSTTSIEVHASNICEYSSDVEGCDPACLSSLRDSSSSDDDSSLSDDDSWTLIDQKFNQPPDSSESDSDLHGGNLKTTLQAWAVECGVTHSQLDKLLPILKEVDGTLPRTAKTLLQENDDLPSDVKPLSGGSNL